VQVNPLVLGAPSFSDGMAEETLRMQEWENDQLRLVERRHPEALIEIGHERSEALSIMRTVMRSYTRGKGSFAGRGFLGMPVSGDIAVTAPREHVPSALIAAYWGWLGTLGILLLLGTLLLPLCALWPEDDEDPGRANGRAFILFGGLALVLTVVYFLPALPTALVLLVMVCGIAFLCWHERGSPVAGPRLFPLPWLPELIAASALATMVFASLYMILSNYGVTLFTGKNVYLLGLDSLSDLLESLALLGLAALAFSYHAHRPEPPNPVSG
jgi:hypothetical protein